MTGGHDQTNAVGWSGAVYPNWAGTSGGTCPNEHPDRGAHRFASNFRALANGQIQIEPLSTVDLERIADLVAQYEDLPLGGTDASIVAIAERLDQTQIATIDHRHFAVVRPNHAQAFSLVP